MELKQELTDTMHELGSTPMEIGRPEAIAASTGLMVGILAVSHAMNPHELLVRENNLEIAKHQQDINNLQAITDGSLLPSIPNSVKIQANEQISKKESAIKEIKSKPPIYPEATHLAGVLAAPIVVATVATCVARWAIKARSQGVKNRIDYNRRRGIS